MSDNKLLKENTIRRFMKLANVRPLSDEFIQNRSVNEEVGIDDEDESEGEMPMDAPEEEPMMDDPEGEMDLDMDDLDPEEEEIGDADISLTEEEARILIDLGERLREAMGEEEDLDMDADSLDLEDEVEDEMPEDPVGEEIPAGDEAPMEDEEEEPGKGGLYEGKDALVQEVLKRVVKRVISERKK